ncbi:MAG: hypothetical protein JF586_10010 [Burkholderiales bacterium]|jgi:hypothetical protein|nr:hypothetical protein [Burkholderiales bacterium]
MWQRSIARDIEREACKAQMLAVPEAKRLESGRQFMSAHNRRLLREQAAMSATDDHQGAFPADFVDDFNEPGPDDDFEFGIDYRAGGASHCDFRFSRWPPDPA